MLRRTRLYPRREEGLLWSPGGWPRAPWGATNPVNPRARMPAPSPCWPLHAPSTPWGPACATTGSIACVRAQWCPTLCDPMGCGPPLWPSVLGISRARIPEWVAIPFSRGSSRPGTEPVSPALAGGYHSAIWEALGPTVRSCQGAGRTLGRPAGSLPWPDIRVWQTSQVGSLPLHVRKTLGRIQAFYQMPGQHSWRVGWLSETRTAWEAVTVKGSLRRLHN